MPCQTTSYQRYCTDNRDEVAFEHSQKRVRNVAFILINLLKKKSNLLPNYQLWTIENALYTLDDKISYSKITTICKSKELGKVRQLLLWSSERTKDTEAYDVLLNSLTALTVRVHAIETHGLLGNPETVLFWRALKFRRKNMNTNQNRLQLIA